METIRKPLGIQYIGENRGKPMKDTKSLEPMEVHENLQKLIRTVGKLVRLKTKNTKP